MLTDINLSRISINCVLLITFLERREKQIIDTISSSQHSYQDNKILGFYQKEKTNVINLIVQDKFVRTEIAFQIPILQPNC